MKIKSTIIQIYETPSQVGESIKELTTKFQKTYKRAPKCELVYSGIGPAKKQQHGLAIQVKEGEVITYEDFEKVKGLL